MTKGVGIPQAPFGCGITHRTAEVMLDGIHGRGLIAARHVLVYFW